jgi:hypothetical protein
MFIKVHNARFKTPMWTDSRLVNTAPDFCLCSSCAKSNIRENVICPIHDEFMKMTESLKIACPVFACGEFEELKNTYNYLDQYYDDSGLQLSTEKSKAQYYEHVANLKADWKAQNMKWQKEEYGNTG